MENTGIHNFHTQTKNGIPFYREWTVRYPGEDRVVLPNNNLGASNLFCCGNPSYCAVIKKKTDFTETIREAELMSQAMFFKEFGSA